MTKQRILIISHGHPKLSKGGAEEAAYNLFKEYDYRCLDVLLLARADLPSHGGSTFSVFNTDREILFHTKMDDFFIFTNCYKKHVWQDFRDLLKSYLPDVVHFHHYIHLGLELIREVKNTLPDAKIILTLHEYLAICANNGQMVRRSDAKLCYKASPLECSVCFPDRTAADFFLREKYIKTIFELVDSFVSPSHFLISRYRTWGIPEEKMIMIENGQPEMNLPLPRVLSEGEGRGRFSFLGQINPFKGVDVLLEAFKQLPEETKEKVRLDIYGANLDKQKEEFQHEIKKLLDELEDIVSFHGSYESHEKNKIFQETDWVIVPSIWWENSPMVIQEAFNHGRPLIVSDIGGMAEKVLDNENGLHFRVKMANSLSQKVEEAIDKESLWTDCYKAIKQPLTISECASAHLDLYNIPSLDKD